MKIVGNGMGLQHGQVVLGLHARDVGPGFGAVGKHQPDALGGLDHMQVGEDDPLVGDLHPVVQPIPELGAEILGRLVEKQ